ncbi:PREDICTED: 3-epi-6-deoxocathasterone 23-monooxygenase [Camelina sativa]|uniref:3-epi-6-deoxocathasterone 23-monooxygenase n=1 Tax=Camelina sativa TaxID=90675 RepID=A0ABM0XK37_CAMSA|nr:PREDICTED: 3-epi-6-deoxocathasterone 23-monooxygenase [Camelina sativa]
MDTSLSLLPFFFFFFSIIIILNKINRLRSSPASKNKLIDRHVISHSQESKFPQGSLGWPVLGETIEFVSSAYSNHPESFMDKRRLLYGRVFKSHIFGTATIVSTDAEVNRAVLQSDSTAFVPFYPKTVRELMGKSSILLINGSSQRRFHGLVGSFLKSPLLKAQIVRDMHKYLSESMDLWSEDQPVLIQDVSKTVAFKVLAKALISVEKGDELEELKKEFEQFISGLMSLPINFPGTQLHRSLQAKKKMVRQVERIIEGKTRRAKNKEEDVVIAKDVVDVLLKDSSEYLTHNLIANNMIDMMIPGHDSVPVLITLAVKFLSDSPAALNFLTEENMKLKSLKELTGEPLYWNDYLSLPFTQKVITETLRMGNVIIGVMRKAMKDIEIKGYMIPKGWCFLAYLRSVHLDKLYYDSPYKFNPWRWQDRDMNTSSFSPFGGGQRLCPGLDLARLEASIFLHHLVTRFRWIAEEDSVKNFPTVHMKKKLPIWIKRR